jgi:glycosyltransferase involved in cell wall biosynthesis
MRVLLTNEHRFDAGPDGSVWTQTSFAYSFWARYLEVYSNVHLVARIKPANEIRPEWVRADGEGVTFSPLPHYIGPFQYLAKAFDVRRLARMALGGQDAVIMRVPSTIAAALASPLRRSGRPFGLEVVGDPFDVFAPGAIRHPLRPLFRFWFSRQLQRQCARASAIHYVTEKSLQSRYAPPPDAYSVNFSDVELSNEAFALEARRYRPNRCNFTIITVGTLAQLYKGPDILLAAFSQSLKSGFDLRLIFIGDGKYRPELERRAYQRGLGGRVRFLGQLPTGMAVLEQLDLADIFVLPSRVEGLPRAMIEAMGRALPCIGSTAGGIPELLPPEDLVPPGDVEKLASKFIEVLKDSDRMSRLSERNLASAMRYREDVSRKKRLLFYEYVRDKTQAWLDGT